MKSRTASTGFSQADFLLKLGSCAEPFHTPEGEAFVQIPVREHFETHPVRGPEFESWLHHRFYQETRRVPKRSALLEAIRTIEADAKYNCEEASVYVRVTRAEDTIYLDLCDSQWRCVEVKPNGWQTISEPPIRFRRPDGARALPEPERGGSVAELRSFLNVSDQAFVACVSWLLGALSGRGPYPVLPLSGEQGSTKTMTARIQRALIDPSQTSVRSLPREERDLIISSQNSHVLAFDNISSLGPKLSDALCRVATGGGFATRRLYTDRSEVIFTACRPIILTGIGDFITRGDLADRSFFVRLEPIPESRRRPEAELWAEFQRARPRILGALLDALASGLREEHGVTLRESPRMADFARWVVACEGALPWKSGTFMATFSANRFEAHEAALEDDLVATAVRDLLSCSGEWTGTADELLARFLRQTDGAALHSKAWPSTPRGIRSALDRAAPALRAVGIEIESRREPTRKRRRLITIRFANSPAREGWGMPRPSSSEVRSSDGMDGLDDSDRNSENDSRVNKQEHDSLPIKGACQSI